jgi:5-methylthioadenosine/S-adenosylhomocysteine deaminase
MIMMMMIMARGRYGMRTPQWMAERGLLGPNLLAVHLTEATPEEAAMIAESGATMAVCNGSIGIIDGVVCPAVRAL